MDVWGRITSRWRRQQRTAHVPQAAHKALDFLQRASLRSHSSAVNRLTVLALALMLWALAILGKLVDLQVIQRAKYVAIARSQQEHEVDSLKAYVAGS